MAFSRALGFVSTLLMLSVVYLLFFGPARLVVRVLGKDLLDKRLLSPESQPTFWRAPEHPGPRSEEDYRHLF